MSRLRRFCALAIVGLFAAVGLLSAPPAKAFTYSGNRVPGDVTIYTPDCYTDVSNNWVNGSLTVVAVGLFCVNTDLTMDVHGNIVRGGLNVIVSHSTTMFGNIVVHVHDNAQVGGMLNVTVNSNTVHKYDPATAYDYNLRVEVFQNGGNYAGATRNEVVAKGIDIEVNDNWVKNSLFANARNNFVARDLAMEVNGNLVNNLFSNIEKNRACRDMDISFVGNLIDTKFYLSATENSATRDVKFNLASNRVVYLDPMKFEAEIKDNHAATGEMNLVVSGTIAKMIIVKYEDNGAGGDGRFSVLGNTAILFIEVQINRNRVDGRSTIRVMGNTPTPAPYIISDNWACLQGPVIQPQPKPVLSLNKRSCTQTMGADGDRDGLKNDYEKMIGTDSNHWDTDRDGLSDGWNDNDGNGRWDRGTDFGELGNPLRPLGGSREGAVDTLFNRPSEAPNCFCKDLYVEVDFMQKGKTIRRPGVPFGIVVNKTADVRQARPGEPVNYTVRYNNTGPVAKFVWVNDTLPSLVTFVNATPIPSYQSGRLVRWNFTMVTHGSYQIELKVRISSSASIGTSLVNNVVLNYTDQRGRLRPSSSDNVTVVVSSVRLSAPGASTQNVLPGEVPSAGYVMDEETGSWSSEGLGASRVEIEEGIPIGGTYSLVDKPHFITWATVKPVADVFEKRGIYLHVDLGWPMGAAGGNAYGGGEFLRHKSLLDYWNATAFDFFNFKNGEVRADYDGNGIREPRHFSLNRGGVFHYTIVGHNYSGAPLASGFGERPGDDLFIAHGNFLGFGYTGQGIGQALSYALCHELGHNLGLGGTPGTHENAPPDYYSCMSYNAAVVFSYIGYSDGQYSGVIDWMNMNFAGAFTNWNDPRFTK